MACGRHAQTRVLAGQFFEIRSWSAAVTAAMATKETSAIADIHFRSLRVLKPFWERKTVGATVCNPNALAVLSFAIPQRNAVAAIAATCTPNAKEEQDTVAIEMLASGPMPTVTLTDDQGA